MALGQKVTQKYLNDKATEKLGNLILAFRELRALHDYTGGLDPAAVLALPDPDGIALTTAQANVLLSAMTIADVTFKTALGATPVGSENQLMGFATQLAKIV